MAVPWQCCDSASWQCPAMAVSWHCNGSASAMAMSLRAVLSLTDSASPSCGGSAVSTGKAAHVRWPTMAVDGSVKLDGAADHGGPDHSATAGFYTGLNDRGDVDVFAASELYLYVHPVLRA